MTFKEKLVILRKSKGLTQDEFASAVGVSRQAVYKWECGQSYPEVPKLLEMKLLFTISIDELLDDSIDIPVPEKKRKKRISKDAQKKIEESVEKEVKMPKPAAPKAAPKATPAPKAAPAPVAEPVEAPAVSYVPNLKTASIHIPKPEEAMANNVAPAAAPAPAAPAAPAVNNEEPVKKTSFFDLFRRK